jgi:Leucine-rich repeat (LRR) protein
MKKSKSAFIIGLAVGVISLTTLLSTCSNLFSDFKDTKPVSEVSLTIFIGVPSAKTVMPNFNDAVAGYEISGQGPSGSSFGPISTNGQNPETIDGLLAGEWTVTVSGTDGDGAVVCSGQAAATLTESENSITVDVNFSQEGTGGFSIVVTWPAEIGIDEVQAGIDEEATEDIYSSGNAVDFSWTNLSSGVHIAILQLYADGVHMSSVIEAVNIFDNLISEKTIELTADNFGSSPNVPTTPVVSTWGPFYVTFSWDPSSVLTETAFIVQRDTSDQFGDPAEFSLDPNTSEIMDDGVEEDTTYFYRVCSENEFGRSGWLNANEFNTGTSDGKVDYPVFSPSAGVFETAQEITMTSSTEGAEIHYTLDGSTPDIFAPLYTGPVLIESSAVVLGIAVKPGMYDSYINRDDYAITTLDETNMLVNGDFSQDRLMWWESVHEDDEADADFSFDNEEAYVSITAGGYNPWSVNLQYFPILLLEQGKVYQLDFDAKADTDRIIWAVFQESGTDNNGDGNNNTDYFNTEVQLSTTYESFSYYVVMNEIDDPTTKLQFRFGIDNPGVSIDNVVLVETDLTVVEQPYFEPNNATFASAGSVEILTDTAGASIYYTTDGSDPDDSSAYYDGSIPVSENTTIKAIAIKDSWIDSIISQSGFAIIPDGESNMIANGNFSEDSALWWSWHDDKIGGLRNYTVTSGVAFTEVVASGWEFWALGLDYLPFIQFEQAKIYDFSFDAYSTEDRTIGLYLGEHNIDNNGDGVPYTMYLYSEIDITTELASYTGSMAMNEITDPTGQFAFHLGRDSGDVYIDNVILIERDPVPITAAEIPDEALRQVIADNADVALADLNELHILDITDFDGQDGGITDLTGIHLLSNLDSLGLWTNNVSNLDPIVGMTQINALHLQDNPLGFTALSVVTDENFPQLSSLFISNEVDLGTDIDAVIGIFEDLPNLEDIGMGDFNLSDSQFSDLYDRVISLDLNSFCGLDIYHNNFTDTTLEIIGNISNLEWINLNGNPISDLALISNLTNLQQILIDSTGVTNLEPLRSLYDAGAFDQDWNRIDVQNLSLDLTPGTNNREVVDYLLSEGVNLEWQEGNTVGSLGIGFTPTELGVAYYGADGDMFSNDVYIYDGNVDVATWRSTDTGIIDIVVFEAADYTEDAGLTPGTHEYAESGVGPLGRFYGVILGRNFNAETGTADYIAGTTEWVDAFDAAESDLIVSTTVTVSVDGDVHTYDYTIGLEDGTTIAGSYSDIPVVMNHVSVPVEDIPDENLRTVLEEHTEKAFEDIMAVDLANLVRLDVDERSVADITGLELCTGLEWLNLQGNTIIDFSPLYGLTNLVDLTIGDAATVDLSGFTSMTSLVKLTMDDMPIDETDITIFTTSNFPNLEYLGLWAGGSSFSSVGAVVDVLANDTGLFNYGLAEFGMNDTQFQDVYDTLIAPRLGAHLSEFTELRLSENALSGAVLSSIVNMTALEALQLSDNNIGDLSSLAVLTNLQELDVHGSGLAGTDLTFLQTLYYNGAFRDFGVMGYGGYVDISENNLDLTTGTANRDVVNYLLANNVYVEWESANTID